MCYELRRFRLSWGRIHPSATLDPHIWTVSEFCWFFHHGVSYTHPFLSLKWPYFSALLSLIILPSIHPPYSFQNVTCLFDKIFYHLPNHWLKYKLIFFWTPPNMPGAMAGTGGLKVNKTKLRPSRSSPNFNMIVPSAFSHALLQTLPWCPIR